MFGDVICSLAESAKAKLSLLKTNPVGYFLASMLAGIYIGVGVLLAFTSGGLLSGSPFTKIMMGLSFGVALSLVVAAGGELFTGNNLVMTAGVMNKTVGIGGALGLWVFCWLGNLAGSILLGVLFNAAGLAQGSVGEFIAAAAATKMNLPFTQLLCRGILCNMLVCLAVWCSAKLKSESARLIMVFWCLFAFITTGFEHSIANMTLMTVAMLAPFGSDISIGGFAYNLAAVTLGNMIGGIILVALPYYVISLKKKQ